MIAKRSLVSIVDDDESVRESLPDLVRQFGFAAEAFSSADAFLAELATLTPGDLVVHTEHGIGRYEGLTSIPVGQSPHDCVALSYAGGDKLYVPVENIDVLSRYGSSEEGATLDRLGGEGWQRRKSKKEIAEAIVLGDELRKGKS